MTYHAIPGIPKSTCTAEQKNAYNIAYNLYGTYSAQYIKRKDNVSGVAKSEFFHQLVSACAQRAQPVQALPRLQARQI